MERERGRIDLPLVKAGRQGDQRMQPADPRDRDAQKASSVFATVDRATRRWRGSVGVITTLIPHAPIDPENSLVMVCGPEIMMHFTINELHRRGVGSDQIYVSMERNMKCAIGLCGHCQFGPHFVCKDGPVFRFDRVEEFFSVREF